MTAHILKFLTPGIFFLALTGCDNGTSAENQQLTQALVKRSLDNMVPVAGGEFLMGDFGPLIWEKLPFSSNQDDKYLHKVRLSDFMIGKYKVTHKDYNEYIKITHRKKLVYLWKGKVLADGVSVSVPWQMAKDYCLWLGKMSGKRVDLPTEAQWEYAARSRGQYLPYATSNGKIERGVNVPTSDEKLKMTGTGFPYYPVGKYPPNPLGLYDMGLSGQEWVNDWYAADYYAHSPVDNPQGPESGDRKVQRGYAGGVYQYALTMFRESDFPSPLLDGRKAEDNKFLPNFVFRCVVNNG
ncbi:SUMF1/EgtB/PvdO family nonheme iron enzyme [Citrobacter portucalensis]|nr:SUMF1/EgtB/PvdO family nonheme iron enzyme [Citrobacter portucalensis]MEB1079534.1 SUMF1/EgtB/PvdO family nonheme iron enzyme [Citrobacter portucalensis]